LIVRSYLQSGDGSSQISATINAPRNDYADEAAFALVKGELIIFGGWSDGYKVLFCLTNQNYEIIKNSIIEFKNNYKISRLDGCSLKELPARLNEERYYGHAAVSVENGQKGKTKFFFKNFFKFLSSCLLRLFWRQSQILRDFRRLISCFDFHRRMDS
jgi:hypothetical protein